MSKEPQETQSFGGLSTSKFISSARRARNVGVDDSGRELRADAHWIGLEHPDGPVSLICTRFT